MAGDTLDKKSQEWRERKKDLIKVPEDLVSLRKELFKQELEKYRKDPKFESACKKIFGRVINILVKDEWKSYAKMDVSQTVRDIIGKFPEYWANIVFGLWLPNWDEKFSFSDLSDEGKLKFISLYKASQRVWKNKINLMDVYKREYDILVNQLSEKLSNMNLKNFLIRFQTTKESLKQNFWLTESECRIFLEFANFLKKNENIFKNNVGQVQKAWIWVGIAIGVIGTLALEAILFWVWYIWYQKLQDSFHFFDLEPWVVDVEEEEVEITSIEGAERMIAVDIWFHKNKKFTREQFSQDDIKGTTWLFGSDLEKSALRFWKRLINVAQSRDVILDLNWKFELQYDFAKEHWTKVHIDTKTETLVVETKTPELRFSDDHDLKRKVDTERIALDSFEEAEYKEFKDWIEGIKGEVKEKEEYDMALNMSAFRLLKHYHEAGEMFRGKYKVNNIRIHFTDTWNEIELNMDDVYKYSGIEFGIIELGKD